MKRIKIDRMNFDAETDNPIADAITIEFFNRIDNSFKRKLEKRTHLYQNINEKK